MQIDPKLSMWLNIAYLILTAIGTGAITLTGLVSGTTATEIVALAALGSGILNIVLHGMSGPNPGPMVK